MPLIHYYAENGYKNDLIAEIDKGTDINCTLGNLLVTPLHSASARGQVEAVKILLERGADIYAQDCLQQTALYTACGVASTINEDNILQKYYMIFDLLLAHEAKLRKEHPEQYDGKPWLKDIKPHLSSGLVPVLRLRGNPPAQQKLKKIISEHCFEDKSPATLADKEGTTQTVPVPSKVPQNSPVVGYNSGEKENFNQQTNEGNFLTGVISKCLKSIFFNTEQQPSQTASEIVPLLGKNKTKAD